MNTLQIEHKLKFCRLNNGQIHQLLAFQYMSDIDPLLAMTFRLARPVAHQAAGDCALSPWGEHWKLMPKRQSREMFNTAAQEYICRDQQRGNPLFGERCKRLLEFLV